MTAALSADVLGYGGLNEVRAAALTAFLIRELTPITPAVLMQDMVSPAALEVFNTAFTHTSASARNYDIFMETEGDAVLKAAFINYLKKIFPGNLSSGMLTNFVAYYLSKPYMNALSIRRGMPPLIIVAPDLNEITVDIAEDVFEAFAGALVTLGDRFGLPRLGYEAGTGLVRNYVAMLFNEIPLAADSVRGSAKGELGIRASKLNWTISTLQYSLPNQPRQFYHYTARANFNPAALALVTPQRTATLRQLFGLDEIRKNPDDYVLIGSGRADTAQSAEENSAADALVFMDNAGYTLQAADAAKQERDFRIPRYRELALPLIERFGDFTFRTQDLSGMRKLYMLMVTGPDRSEVQLTHIIVPTNTNVSEARVRLLAAAQEVLGRPVPTLPPLAPAQARVQSGRNNRGDARGDGRGRGRGRGGRP